MSLVPQPLQNLTELFRRLPGIGPKTAARLAYFFVNASNDTAQDMAKAIVAIKNDLKLCQSCYNVSSKSICPICEDSQRDQKQICIVEAPLDIVTIEEAGFYKGRYFVIAGLLSPVRGIGPQDIRLQELTQHLKSIAKDDSLQIIVALNPSVEGETTALYIKKLISEDSQLSQKTTLQRLGMGLPTGADIDYADEVTLRRAFEGRVDL